MEVEDLKYKPEGLINDNISYELSVLINADSFFYGILDYSRFLKKSQILRNFHNESLTELEDINIRKVKTAIINDLFTIIPNSEFSSSNASELLELSVKLDDSSKYIIRNDYCEQFDLRVIYAVPKSLLKKLQKSFDSPSMNHFIFSCLDTITLIDKSVVVRLVSLNEEMVLIVTKGNELLFANCFSFDSDSSFIYFLSLLFDRLQLDHEKQLIELSGFINPNDELITLLNRFYGNVHFVDVGMIKKSNVSVHDHYFHPLYCISKCA